MADFFDFVPGYRHYVYDTGREPLFFLLLAFLLTFAAARTYTRLGRTRGWRSGSLRGIHLHHLVPGVVATLGAGTAIIAFQPGNDAMLGFSALFGCGAALTLDEFALILHLDDVYWTTEGRLSIDACMAAVAFLGLAVMVTFPLPTDPANERLARALGDGLIAVLACFVVVTLLKGKLKLGLLGIVFPPLAVVAALRLAKPSSIWARRFYPAGGWRMRRSQARLESREARWTHRRERVYDLIGGAPHLGSKRDSLAKPK